MAREATIATRTRQPTHPLLDAPRRAARPAGYCAMRNSARLGVKASRAAVLALAAATALLASGSAPASETRPVPETYTATTAEMTPAGNTIKIEVMEWSSDDARANAVAALASKDEPDKALSMLPTVGYVWRSGSGVGYSIKYALRETTPDNGERITVVTDKPIDSYSFKPWSVKQTTATKGYGYSVIELQLDHDGHGSGTTSLAADVKLDAAGHTVSLQRDSSTPNVLKDAKHEPKPYWAK